MSNLIERLRKDLEPYRGKTVGSLRIDMGEVQKILATADQLEAQQAEIARLRETLATIVSEMEYPNPLECGFVHSRMNLKDAVYRVDIAKNLAMSALSAHLSGDISFCNGDACIKKSMGLQKARPVAAIEQLRSHQRQLDQDGCFVGVSRQAIDEVLQFIDDASEQEQKP